jgi:hypothetical protein
MVKDWKKAVWQDKEHIELHNKFIKLKVLAIALGVFYEKPVNVEFIPQLGTCSYNPKNQTIFINESTSIISLLHEFAHHRFGSNELKACRWSVWLFKKTFPKAFQKLKWKGHMLKKIC